jgi:excisionase family DNA binding protein
MTQRLPKRIRCQSDKDNQPDKNGNPTYISMKEACNILFLSESTVRHHIIKNRIKAFKSCGKWYLRKLDVESFKRLLIIQGKTD